MSFNQSEFDNFILDNGVVGFHEDGIRLRSGRTSHWYVNWRALLSDVALADALSDFVVSFIRQLAPETSTIFGVAEGATKVGILSQYKWAKAQAGFQPGSHILAMGRGKEKEHGSPNDRFFLGVPQGETVVVEDTTTTGESLVASVHKLRESQVQIKHVLSMTDRMEKPANSNHQSVAARIEKEFSGEVAYRAMSSAKTLLPLAIEKFSPSSKVVEALRTEYAEFGSEVLSF